MRLDAGSLSQEYVLSGATLVDPATKEEQAGEIWVREGVIHQVVFGGQAQADETVPRVDVSGLHLAPGFIDVHVHFREPGFEYKEDIESGSRAGVAGGFTGVVMMPNTDPPMDNAGTISTVLQRGREIGLLDVYCAGALTIGRGSEKLAEYYDLQQAGCVTLTDDGDPVVDPQLMRRALEHASMLGLVVMAHSEEKALSCQGVMHEGYWSTQLGLPGIPAAAEEIGVARDLLLAREAESSIHIAHVSTKGAVDLIRLAKNEWKVDVTAEATPHHVSLTDRELVGYSSNYKMNPPLRPEHDRIAVQEAFIDGSIDMMATDHAPHAAMEKDLEFERAPVGVIGLESAFAIMHTDLVAPNKMSLMQLVDRMSLAPANRFGLRGGKLAAGEPANIVVLDTLERWRLTPELICSKSKNSSFMKRSFKGRVHATIYEGRLVHRAAPVLDAISPLL